MLEEADEILHNKVLNNPFLLVNGTKSSDMVLSYGSVQSGNGSSQKNQNGEMKMPMNPPWKKTV